MLAVAVPTRGVVDLRVGGSTTSHSRSAGGRDRFLDLVRAVAIIRVLVIHAAATTGSLWWPLPSWILPGMPLVFFTSGALAAPSVLRHGAERFHRDRYRRLLLPYWVFLLTGLAVLAVAGMTVGGDRWTPRWWRVLDAVVPVVQPRVAPGLTDLGTHLWFASAFLLLIACTPLLVRLQQRRPLLPLAACSLVFALLTWVDRCWFAVPIEVLYVPMYGIFLAAGIAYADGSLVGRTHRPATSPPTPARRPFLNPLTAGLILAGAVIGGWASYRYGARDLNHDLVGHTCVAAGWLVLVLAARRPLGRLADRLARPLDRITPRTLTLYLWSAPAGVLAWRFAEGSPNPRTRLAAYLIGTLLLTVLALWAFGRIEDRAAGRDRFTGTAPPTPTRRVDQSDSGTVGDSCASAPTTSMRPVQRTS